MDTDAENEDEDTEVDVDVEIESSSSDEETWTRERENAWVARVEAGIETIVGDFFANNSFQCSCEHSCFNLVASQGELCEDCLPNGKCKCEGSLVILPGGFGEGVCCIRRNPINWPDWNGNYQGVGPNLEERLSA